MVDGLITQKGFPHSGWECVGIEENPEMQLCECCGKQMIRYVHKMRHPEFTDIEVGCICAGFLEGNLERAKERESYLRRKEKFIHGRWTEENKARQLKCYKRRGARIYYLGGDYGVWYNDRICWKFHGHSMRSFDEAAEAAFEVYECSRA